MPRSAALALTGAVTLLMATVSGSSTSAGAGETTRPRPAGPSADLTPTSGGNGVYLGEPIPVNLERAGYVEREYFASGTATSYSATSPLAEDGRWSFAPDGTAPYRTRVLVRRPSDRARFSGTVVVEWMNVSGGVDSNPEWSTTHEEILRRGDAWVGVSAQRIGVEGGPVAVTVSAVPGSEAAGVGLKTIDPARYGSLEHPGDGFAFDIYTQVARAARSGAGLAGLRPKRVIAAGQSQSAFALVTYYNGVQPLTHAFDGFFVHSRLGVAMPLVGPGEYADIVSAIGGTSRPIFRTDQDAPVLDVQTESDITSVINSYPARQPDSDHFRLWEVAGTAHADAHLLGSTAQYIQCGVPINNGALHVVAKAGLRALMTWVETGKAPPKAARIDVASGASPQIQRNADGIALGGIRTPPVDVPVAELSGAPGPTPSVICLLLGSTEPFSAERLARLYPSRAVYKQRYDRAAGATIKAGFVLPEDRAALLEFSEPSQIAG